MDVMRSELDELSKRQVQTTCGELLALKQNAIANHLQMAATLFRRKRDTECAAKCQPLLEMCWSQLRNGGWGEVCWKEAYIFGKLFLAVTQAFAGDPCASLVSFDTAGILGGPWDYICASIAVLESTLPPPSPLGEGSDFMLPSLVPSHSPPISLPVKELVTPDVLTFREECYDCHRSAVIDGCLSEWPALGRWRDLRYFQNNFGRRTIPIEVGLHHTGHWRECLLTVNEFVSQYLVPDNKRSASASYASPRSPDTIGYLAQHTLFKQLPQLMEDFAVPSLCAVGSLTNINAWFGTSGTVTPLHFDSYDNFLTQVVGYKYVRLYDPSQSPFLYQDNGDPVGDPHGDPFGDRIGHADVDAENCSVLHPSHPASTTTTTTTAATATAATTTPPSTAAAPHAPHSTRAQRNLSRVDVENPDLTRFPLFASAQYSETVLAPGQMLFIPAGHWHFVRSLTPSFSVNFWF